MDEYEWPKREVEEKKTKMPKEGNDQGQQQQQHHEKTITPFCYPKANLIHKQAQLHEKIGLRFLKNYDNLYEVFFKSYKCWDTVPNSSKLIILDTSKWSIDVWCIVTAQN